MDAMEEIRKMREKLYGKKAISNSAQKEKGSKFKSPYLAMWASKINKRNRMSKKPIRPRAM